MASSIVPIMRLAATSLSTCFHPAVTLLYYTRFRAKGCAAWCTCCGSHGTDAKEWSLIADLLQSIMRFFFKKARHTGKLYRF